MQWLSIYVIFVSPTLVCSPVARVILPADKLRGPRQVIHWSLLCTEPAAAFRE